MAHQRYSEQEWKELVLKFESRQISSTEFCKLHNISRAMMYKWRDNFKELVGDFKSSPSPVSNTPVSPPTSSGTSESRKLGKFIPLEVTSSDDNKIAATEEPAIDRDELNNANSTSLSTSTSTSITSSMLKGLDRKIVEDNELSKKENLSNSTDYCISSRFNIRKQSFILEFESGCKISDLRAILEVVDAIK
jgi:hypothetical protein